MDKGTATSSSGSKRSRTEANLAADHRLSWEENKASSSTGITRAPVANDPRAENGSWNQRSKESHDMITNNDTTEKKTGNVMAQRPRGPSIEYIRASSVIHVEAAYEPEESNEEGSSDDWISLETETEVSSDDGEESKKEKAKKSLTLEPNEDPAFHFLRNSLIKLQNNEAEFIAVLNTFLLGFGKLLPAINILGIYKYSPAEPVEIRRLQSFEREIELMKRRRGDANVRGGWHGTTREDLLSIVLHGFSEYGKAVGGSGHGKGVNLYPDKCAHLSSSYSDMDRNGVQRMVFCRVVMGNMEEIPHGSRQRLPSSDDFDSGVDDLQNPKKYVVWSMNMNRHIHPEYVVSFKLPRAVRDHLAAKKSTRARVGRALQNILPAILAAHPVGQNRGRSRPRDPRAPIWAWMPLPMLFRELRDQVSPFANSLLHRSFDMFRGKLLTQTELMDVVTFVIGEPLLHSTLRRLHPISPYLAPSSQQTENSDASDATQGSI